MGQPKEEPISNERLFENAFGDGYWDLPEYDRFEMTVRKMLGQDVPKVTKEEAKARAVEHGED